MNFGEILDKWENSRRSNSGNDEMETWLRGNEIFDKDAGEKKTPKQGELRIRQERRRRLLHALPDDILDIHGLSCEKALISLHAFFDRAKENGYEKLRIIHGKGNHTQSGTGGSGAVLGDTVRAFIEKCPFAGESGYEKAVNGGSGATWVLLKSANSL
ncbi:MAG: Smr/MutS family protein [Treponema sp.]|jgi:DNA-nicking Smr family endonuclease|nr:Smr/MutS family protein [Treponema sp.]